jgi:phage gp36-like protein
MPKYVIERLLDGSAEIRACLDRRYVEKEVPLVKTLRQLVVHAPDIAFAVCKPVADENARHGILSGWDRTAWQVRVRARPLTSPPRAL